MHCGLSTEQLIAEEEDVIWEWNKLFTEVVSVLSVSKESEDKNVNDFGGDEDVLKSRSDQLATQREIKKDKDLIF